MPVTPRLHWPAYSPEATLPKTERLVCPDDGYSESFIQRAVFRLDRVLRKWHGIYEFCQAGDCLLRVAITPARKRVKLPNGRVVRPGDSIIEIHWWNEHVARLIADRPALARAKVLLSLVQHSFEQLARYVATAPEAQTALFIHGSAVLPMHREDELVTLVQDLGFCAVHPPAGYSKQVHDFFEEYLVRALLWAFHRRKARRRRRRVLRRVDLWASRTDFLERYGRARELAVVSRPRVASHCSD